MPLNADNHEPPIERNSYRTWRAGGCVLSNSTVRARKDQSGLASDGSIAADRNGTIDRDELHAKRPRRWQSWCPAFDLRHSCRRHLSGNRVGFGHGQSQVSTLWLYTRNEIVSTPSYRQPLSAVRQVILLRTARL